MKRRNPFFLDRERFKATCSWSQALGIQFAVQPEAALIRSLVFFDSITIRVTTRARRVTISSSEMVATDLTLARGTKPVSIGRRTPFGPIASTKESLAHRAKLRGNQMRRRASSLESPWFGQSLPMDGSQKTGFDGLQWLTSP